MTRTAAAAPVAVVNGPEDDAPTWFEIDWDQAEEDVRRLRQRIFAASQAASGRLRALRACLSRVPRRVARTVVCPVAGYVEDASDGS